MKSKAHIKAGVCGNVADIVVVCTGRRGLSTLEISSGCKTIQALAEKIQQIDGMHEIKYGFEGVIFSEARKLIKGCCAGCIVPAGIFKAVQVANDLALAKDAEISFIMED